MGFRDKYVVKRLMKREKAKRVKLKTRNPIGPKGRPRKDSASGDIVAQQAYKIQRNPTFEIENEKESIVGQFAVRDRGFCMKYDKIIYYSDYKEIKKIKFYA